jgi:hypothetical protein
VTLASDLLSRAPLYLNGSRLETVGQGEPRNRYARAFQELISFAYPNLKMLKGNYDETSLSKALLEPDDLLAGGVQALSEAESEVLTYVRRNQDNGERTSIEETVRAFGRRPYGWPAMATLTLVARLFRMGKVELRTTELLDARTAFQQLRNSRNHGGVRVRMQEQFDASKVNALKSFYHDFFDRANDGTEARSVAERTVEAFSTKARALTLLVDQSRAYPFLAPLSALVTRLEKLADKDHAWLLKHLSEYEGELLTAKQDLLAPIEAFMRGAQRSTFDEVMSFYREEAVNFAELPAADVQPLRDLAASAQPYQGTVLPTAKTAVTRLRGSLAELLNFERGRALTVVDEHETRLKTVSDFRTLEKSRQAQVLAASQNARADLSAASIVLGIRDRLVRYIAVDYPAQL